MFAAFQTANRFLPNARLFRQFSLTQPGFVAAFGDLPGDDYLQRFRGRIIAVFISRRHHRQSTRLSVREAGLSFWRSGLRFHFASLFFIESVSVTHILDDHPHLDDFIRGLLPFLLVSHALVFNAKLNAIVTRSKTVPARQIPGQRFDATNIRLLFEAINQLVHPRRDDDVVQVQNLLAYFVG